MSLKFDTSENQNEKLSSDEEYIYSSGDDTDDGDKIKKQEDIPEYRKITSDNMYEFIIWANERRNKSIESDHFNMVLNSNVDDWVQKNNITWEYAVTVITDIINNQNSIDSQFGISKNTNDSGCEEKIIKPNSSEERRKLFAAAAEKRAAKRF